MTYESPKRKRIDDGLQNVFGVASASIDKIQEAGSNDTVGENMVHLLQKHKDVAVDSDEEVFPGDVISTPSPSTNPLAPQIPIACVVYFIHFIFLHIYFFYYCQCSSQNLRSQ